MAFNGAVEDHLVNQGMKIIELSGLLMDVREFLQSIARVLPDHKRKEVTEILSSIDAALFADVV